MIEFSVGEKLQHVYTKKYLWVLRTGREQVLCRTEDLREIWFYTCELARPGELKENNRGSRFL